MKIHHKISVGVATVVCTLGLAGLVIAATQVSLGTADSFAVLAGTSIVDTTPSVISGDVGLDPAAGTFIGITAGEVTGTIYNNSGTGPGVQNAALLTSAKNDLTAAYINAEGQTPSTAVLASTIDSFSGTGYTLAPGIYKSPSTMGITGTLTLNGSATDVWIFQAVSSLTTASAANIVFTGGAQACNVFWQVGSSATLGTGTLFKGNILALTSITDNGGSTVEGRLLARNGTVTLNNTTVVKATCVTPPSGSSGPRIAPIFPLINVTKIPSPLSLPGGPGLVTYTYTVTNIGLVPVKDVTVVDNKCSPDNFIDGDDNNDSLLDLDESWVYQCTKTLEETEINTVTACASARNTSGGGKMCDTANATVVVSAVIIPPLIHLVKIPSVFVLPAGGGAVTYTYTVTNPGTAPLNNVSVIDDKCTGLPGRVVGHPGDLNKNDLLESNETWQFTCQTNLTQTTTNIGTAEGHANGLTAIDFAPATVVVAVPGLPNTGLPPHGTIPWSIIVSAGVLILALTSLAVALKRRAM